MLAAIPNQASSGLLSGCSNCNRVVVVYIVIGLCKHQWPLYWVLKLSSRCHYHIVHLVVFCYTSHSFSGQLGSGFSAVAAKNIATRNKAPPEKPSIPQASPSKKKLIIAAHSG